MYIYFTIYAKIKWELSNVRCKVHCNLLWWAKYSKHKKKGYWNIYLFACPLIFSSYSVALTLFIPNIPCHFSVHTTLNNEIWWVPIHSFNMALDDTHFILLVWDRHIQGWIQWSSARKGGGGNNIFIVDRSSLLTGKSQQTSKKKYGQPWWISPFSFCFGLIPQFWKSDFLLPPPPPPINMLLRWEGLLTPPPDIYGIYALAVCGPWLTGYGHQRAVY